LFWLLFRFHNVLLLLLTAIILSTALEPLIKRLGALGIGRPAALIIILILFVVIMVLFLWLATPTVTSQGTAINNSFGEGYALLREQLREMPNVIVHRLLLILPHDLPSFIQAASEESSTTVETPMPSILEQSGALLRTGFSLVAIMLLTIYWTLDGEHIRRAAMLLVPIQKRNEVRTLLDEVSNSLGSYIAGQGILGLSIGTLALVAYSLIGLPNALFLAIFAGLMELVPVVGPFIGAAPAVLIALTISPTTALWVIIATVVIQQLENNLLVPRVMRRTIGVNPLVTMMALIGFSTLFGVLGALIALPLAAIIQLLLDRYVLTSEIEAPLDDGRNRLSLLHYETNELVADVRNYIRHKTSEPSAQSDILEDEVEAIALELQSLLATEEQALR
jgi:predicted PurR-regulated permease PerM